MRAPRDPQWATPRPDVLEDVQHQAEAARDDAAAPAERLSGTGEKAPAQGPDSQWAKQWDTPAEALWERTSHATGAARTVRL